MEQENFALRRIDFEFSINLKDWEKPLFKYKIGTKSTDEKEDPEMIYWGWGKLKNRRFYQKGHYWKIETEKPIIKSIQDLGVVEVKNQVFKIMTEWIGKQENDFKASIKRIKHILKTERKPIPAQWTDIFFDWAKSQNQNEISLNQFPEITPEVINEWIDNNLPPQLEKTKIGEKEKIKVSAIRYLLLDKIFSLKEDFKELNNGQFEQLIGFILGINEDTARHLKNGTERYINPSHEKEANKLIDKIKKGEIL